MGNADHAKMVPRRDVTLIVSRWGKALIASVLHEVLVPWILLPPSPSEKLGSSDISSSRSPKVRPSCRRNRP